MKFLQLLSKNGVAQYWVALTFIATLSPIIGWYFLPDVGEITAGKNLIKSIVSLFCIGLVVRGSMRLSNFSDAQAATFLKWTLISFAISYLFLGFSTYYFYYLVAAVLPLLLTSKYFPKTVFVVGYFIFLTTTQHLYTPGYDYSGNKRLYARIDKSNILFLRNKIRLFIDDFGEPPDTLSELIHTLRLDDDCIMTPPIEPEQYNSATCGPLVYLWKKYYAVSPRPQSVYIYSKNNYESELPYLCTPPQVLPDKSINVCTRWGVVQVSEFDWRTNSTLAKLIFEHSNKPLNANPKVKCDRRRLKVEREKEGTWEVKEEAPPRGRPCRY